MESQINKQMVPAFLNMNECYKTDVNIATTLCARDYKGFGTGNEYMNGVIEIETNENF